MEKWQRDLQSRLQMCRWTGVWVSTSTRFKATKEHATCKNGGGLSHGGHVKWWGKMVRLRDGQLYSSEQHINQITDRDPYMSCRACDVNNLKALWVQPLFWSWIFKAYIALWKMRSGNYRKGRAFPRQCFFFFFLSMAAAFYYHLVIQNKDILNVKHITQCLKHLENTHPSGARTRLVALKGSHRKRKPCFSSLLLFLFFD